MRGVDDCPLPDHQHAGGIGVDSQVSAGEKRIQCFGHGITAVQSRSLATFHYAFRIDDLLGRGLAEIRERLAQGFCRNVEPVGQIGAMRRADSQEGAPDQGPQRQSAVALLQRHRASLIAAGFVAKQVLPNEEERIPVTHPH